MATFYLPSSTSGYSTDNKYVKYRIRIVENSYDSSARTVNITMRAFFYRTNTGYTTDYKHTLYYKINGTEYTFSNAYGDYPITSDGVYMNSKTVNVPVNDDGTVKITAYCKYVGSGLESDYNGGSKSLTKRAAKTYTVTFNANGGSGAPGKQTKTHGTALELSDVVPTRSGYTFIGWATSSTATSATYQPGEDYTANKAITLYAVWTVASLIQMVKVRYQNTDSKFGIYTIAYKTALEVGDTFSWSFEETDEYKSASVSYTVSKEQTTYVDIRRKKYNINYDGNGGVCPPRTQSFYYGCDLKLTKNRPTLSGYKFLGWSPSLEDTSVLYRQGNSYDSTDTSNPTLYAIWEKRESDIAFYKTGECYASEFVEDEKIAFEKGGRVHLNTFTEFFVKKDGITSEYDYIEGQLMLLQDEEGNTFISENCYLTSIE